MKINEIAETIEKEGGKLYLVGGAIRDTLLEKPIYDEDYCVTGLAKEKFLEIFPNAKARGKQFEVFDIDGREFALARIDKKTGIGHKNFKVITNKNITIYQDLKRRDLTINAIAKDISTGEIIDPFNGLEDIRNKTIKAINRKYKEDPLRAYRTARFAAQLNFKVETKTLKMMHSLKKELSSLSKERVFEEFKKALAAKKPSIFFNVLKEAKILDVHFKEIYDLIGSLQPEKYHPEGDSYNHTMLALDNCAKITDNLEIRYATLVHDLGKGLTPKEMYPHHYGHDIKGVEPVKNLSNRIGTPIRWKKSGVTSAKEHMKAGAFFKMTTPKKVQFIEKISKTTLGLGGLQVVVYCDKARFNGKKIIDDKYNFEALGRKMLEEINGEYIKEKYNIDGIEVKSKLHQERVKWLKENSKKS